MNVLILNWRDIKNPESGGAEVLTHELARGLIKKGHSVTLFASYFKGSEKEEIIDGINIIREGHPDARHIFNSVHCKAFLAYKRKFKGKVDLVIDEVHGLPFFTPLYVKEKRIVLICEVAGKLWFKIYGPIFGLLGRFTEIFFLRYLYKREIFFTISKSTEKELIENGVSKEAIRIIPMGIRFPANSVIQAKNEKRALLFAGRLSKSKGIEDALLALAKLKDVDKKAELWIIGRGEEEYVNFLKELSRKLHVLKNVRFLGYVSEEEKYKLMAKAYVLISPSIKEGFGLTLPEAGSMGTPSIVYNSPGLVDYVRHEVNGLICKKNSPSDIFNCVLYLRKNPKLYDRLSREAKVQASSYSWEQASALTAAILERI